MKRAKNNYAATRDDRQSSCEVLILPDGRILAHNITPALAQLLADLDPTDAVMRRRAGQPALGQVARPDSAKPDHRLPPRPPNARPVPPRSAHASS